MGIRGLLSKEINSWYYIIKSFIILVTRIGHILYVAYSLNKNIGDQIVKFS
jgi:hypothetical protein